MRTTNILLGVLCGLLLVGIGLVGYPKYTEWQNQRTAEAAAAQAADMEQTMRTLHAFSAECKGREYESDCKATPP